MFYHILALYHHPELVNLEKSWIGRSQSELLLLSKVWSSFAIWVSRSFQKFSRFVNLVNMKRLTQFCFQFFFFFLFLTQELYNTMFFSFKKNSIDQRNMKWVPKSTEELWS